MAQTNPAKFRMNGVKLKKVQKHVKNIKNNLLSGQLYDNFLD